MKTLIGGVAFCAFSMTVMCGVCMAGAEENAPLAGMRIAVDLLDGSHLIGVTLQESLPVNCSFGSVKIPLHEIGKVNMLEDREQAKIDLANGDHVTGIPGWKAIKITTIIGDISIDMVDLREMIILGKPGAADKGLVLWNTLGSEAEVQHSRVGPGGIIRGGSFTDGIQGKAFVANHDQNRMVTFPQEVIPTKAGCIELWAKFEDIPQELKWGANPWLLIAEGFSITLNGNDGHSTKGKGGLCGSAAQLGSCGTGSYGTWTYSQALGGKDPGEWHHYALVWDKDGIKGVGDGIHTVAVLLDGLLNSTSWSEPPPNTSNPAPLAKGELALMADQHLNQGRVILDDLKIWSYAKTDFKESLRARPGPRDR